MTKDDEMLLIALTKSLKIRVEYALKNAIFRFEDSPEHKLAEDGLWWDVDMLNDFFERTGE